MTDDAQRLMKRAHLALDLDGDGLERDRVFNICGHNHTLVLELLRGIPGWLQQRCRGGCGRGVWMTMR